ncbi:hypothetical protein PBY51_014594 [Eleginops maclovinus]|uniref:C2H2-type domain-containing protein n=1 Tax=Eleginops maclovinus TaxID=56733 RepID=A0AAN7WW20_ELEMC|nr:hypothetical protein PBY51_014594 [Eleginops maclovinus]
MHIRQHNADAGTVDHSCSICGKCLSSASSLDRHMLVHSGERPYKCNVCGQTFTTNGNMHRHMKIHEKDPASGLLPLSPPSPNKRRRPSVKRRGDEEGEEPPAKKLVEEVMEVEVRGGEEDLLPCPLCFKTCSSRLELDAHMDTHPDTALRCDLCCLSFRTHRGLLRHNAGVHKLLPQDPSGRPFIQNNPSIPPGFNELAFIDFSCKKFAHIAQVWCETNLRRCISKFHRFVCDGCDRAFPLRSALELHKTTSHLEEPEEPPNTEELQRLQEEHGSPAGEQKDFPPQQSDFLQALGLQHVSTVIHGPSADEVHQAHLDSIKVIQVAPPSSSLPQEPAFLSGGLSLPLMEGLSQRDAMSLLQPFLPPAFLQPDGGATAASSGVKPGEEGGMELADIRQILRVASAAPNQILSLPGNKAAALPGGHGSLQKSMPPLKPKPPITPRSSLTSSTPPPPAELPAGLTGLHQPLPAPTHTLPLQDPFLFLSRGRVGRRPHAAF